MSESTSSTINAQCEPTLKELYTKRMAELNPTKTTIDDEDFVDALIEKLAEKISNLEWGQTLSINITENNMTVNGEVIPRELDEHLKALINNRLKKEGFNRTILFSMELRCLITTYTL